MKEWDKYTLKFDFEYLILKYFSTQNYILSTIQTPLEYFNKFVNKFLAAIASGTNTL